MYLLSNRLCRAQNCEDCAAGRLPPPHEVFAQTGRELGEMNRTLLGVAPSSKQLSFVGLQHQGQVAERSKAHAWRARPLTPKV